MDNDDAGYAEGDCDCDDDGHRTALLLGHDERGHEATDAEAGAEAEADNWPEQLGPHRESFDDDDDENAMVAA